MLYDVGLLAVWHLHLIVLGLTGSSVCNLFVSTFHLRVSPRVPQMLGGGVLPGMVMTRALVDARAGIIVGTRSVAGCPPWDLALPLGFGVGVVRSSKRPHARYRSMVVS